MNAALKMKEIAPKKINGHDYKGQYIPASEAVVIAYKLVSILSGSGDVMPLITSKESNLILDIFSYTLRDGAAINKDNFDNFYTANLGELVSALQYVVEANFGDFLQESGIGMMGAAPAEQRPAKSVKTTKAKKTTKTTIKA